MTGVMLWRLGNRSKALNEVFYWHRPEPHCPEQHSLPAEQDCPLSRQSLCGGKKGGQGQGCGGMIGCGSGCG